MLACSVGLVQDCRVVPCCLLIWVTAPIEYQTRWTIKYIWILLGECEKWVGGRAVQTNLRSQKNKWHKKWRYIFVQIRTNTSLSVLVQFTVLTFVILFSKRVIRGGRAASFQKKWKAWCEVSYSDKKWYQAHFSRTVDPAQTYGLMPHLSSFTTLAAS